MKYLLDTNMVSYWLRGEAGIMARIRDHSPSKLAIASITLAEILYGIEKSPHRKLERLLKIREICSTRTGWTLPERVGDLPERMRY